MFKKTLIIKIFWGLFIIYNTCCHAEDFYSFSKRFGTPIFVYSFTKIGVDNWASGGAALAQNSIPSAALTNPAGFSVSKLSFYAEFGKWATSEWNADTYLNGHFVLPGYISIGLPFYKISASFGYMNYYHFRLRYRTEVRTITDPEGTGEYIESETNIRLNNFFGSARYSPNDKISLGFTMGLNYLTRNDKMWHEKNEGNGFGFIFIAGLLIKPFQKFSFAYNVRYLTNINYDVSVYSQEPVVDENIDSLMRGNYKDTKYLTVPESYPYTAKFPFVFETGVMYQPFSFLSVYSTIELQKWPDNEDRNFVNYHLGAKLSLLKWLTFSTGYFSQKESFIYYGDQKFLTSGIRIQINESISLSACIMDSHILKEEGIDDSFYQTFISTGISYSK